MPQCLEVWGFASLSHQPPEKSSIPENEPMNPQVDVRRLAVERDESKKARIATRRHWMSRYVLPTAILIVLVGLLGWAARDVLLPAREVTVMPVIARATTAHEAGTPLFTAAGWVEARPTPILVAALADGVIDKLPVVEGQAIEAGEPVAMLIDADARLALEQAEAELTIRESELQSARATVAAARTNAEQPVRLEAALAEADSLLAEAETELSGLPFEIEAFEAQLHLAEQELQRKSDAADAVPGRELQSARSARDAAAARLAQLKARSPRLADQCAALRRRCEALGKQLELRTDETRQLAEAQAREQAAAAELRRAQIAVRAAQLRLERMVIRAPVSGRVLDLVARPGTRVVGAAGTTEGESTVATLYDPGMLQVRADVRLEDLAGVSTGQPVRIETAAVSGSLEGEVLQATSEADVQKNTLEVKVALIDPPRLVKPEMLVQVTFLSQATAEGLSPSEERLRVFAAKGLLDNGPDGTFVWVADQASGVARRRTVKLGSSTAGTLVEIAEGLDPSSRLIVAGREALSDGARIEIVGEDVTMGIGEDGHENPADTQ